jgi:hypothetical protein
MQVQPQAVTLVVEHGGSETLQPVQERFMLRRNRRTQLFVEHRQLV